MSMQRVGILALVVVFLAQPPVWADVFGTGPNQFTIDFAPISGGTNPTDTNPSGGYGIVNYDYRIGVYEITNDQWDKFVAEGRGGNPLGSSYYNGAGIPVNRRSWFQAAHFVNWLNTSTGHQAAYQFDGQGNFVPWAAVDAWDGTNLYRHENAFYFLPSEDEWVKAGYFNGTVLQNYATKPNDTLQQGDGTSGTGWNYYDNGVHATSPPGPWLVGSGSEELSGTYDLMGNVWEMIESPWNDPNYGASSSRVLRGGAFGDPAHNVLSSGGGIDPTLVNPYWGFRVASAVPEPASVTLLFAGIVGLLPWRRRRNA